MVKYNIPQLTIITAVMFFIIGNPYTYAYMSKLTGLKIKNKTHHFLLVGIHSLVMSLVMFGVFGVLVLDKTICPPPKKCPPPPPPKKCPTCETDKKDSTDSTGSTDSTDSTDSNIDVIEGYNSNSYY